MESVASICSNHESKTHENSVPQNLRTVLQIGIKTHEVTVDSGRPLRESVSMR